MTLAEVRAIAERAQAVIDKRQQRWTDDDRSAWNAWVKLDLPPRLIAAMCRVVEAGDAAHRERIETTQVSTDAGEAYEDARYDLDALLREVDGG